MTVQKAKAWLNARRKAIAAIAVPVAVWWAAKHGLELDTEQAGALAVIISGGAVYAVPNKGA